MKKTLLLLSLFLSYGTVSFSQMPIVDHESSKSPNNSQITGFEKSISRASTPSSSTAAIGDTIFHETFGNGLNGDGTNGTWSNYGAPNTALWEYRGTSTTPDNTTGSQGAYNNGRGPIASATTGNGFFIFDSDYMDNGGVPGNFGQGTAPSPHTGYLESPSFDLSSYGNVIFQISSYYRRFQSDCFVEFSTDGGSSWNYSIQIYGESDVATNASTPTLDITTHYLPVGIGGSNNVKFRLVFDGTDTSNPNGSGYYFWQVDDIYVLEAPQNDLTVEKPYFNGIADSNSARYYYTRIPERQADNTTATLGAVFNNLGSVTQPNVKAGVEINGPTSSTITSTNSIANLPSNIRDSLDAGTYTFNAGQGQYELNFYAFSDSTEDNKINDTNTTIVDVTDNIYSWASANNIGYRTTNASSSYEICLPFDFYNNDTAVAIGVRFNHSNDPNDPNNLVVGSDFLSFRILDASQFDANNSYIGGTIAEYSNAGSTFYPIQAGDTGAVITVPLTHSTSTPTLTAGTYYACVKTYNVSAFMSSDQSRSDDNWRPGTTIVDVDNANSWAGFRVTPTIQLFTKGSVDPCTGTNITATFTEDETSQTNGSITATASGGTPNYTYNWTFPDASTQTGASLTGLSIAGDYKLTVTDLLGCQSAEMIHNLAGCVGLANVNVTTSVTNASSSSANDGSIDLSVSGGSNAPTYSWTGPNGFSSTNEDISSLPIGTYNVTITDPLCAILTTDRSIDVYVTSINDISFAESISIYPNPNQGVFTIDIHDATTELQMTISNAIGQTMLQRTFNRGSFQENLSIESYPTGIYFIKFMVEGEKEVTYKMIKH